MANAKPKRLEKCFSLVFDQMLFNNLDSSNKETKFNQAELGIRKLAKQS